MLRSYTGDQIAPILLLCHCALFQTSPRTGPPSWFTGVINAHTARDSQPGTMISTILRM